MNTLTINNKNVNDDVVSGLKSFELSIARNNDDNTIDKTVSTEIVVRGETASLIKETFFENCNNIEASFDATFKTDLCGGYTAQFKITADTVKWCSRLCEARINLKSEDEEDACYDRLKNNYWWEGGFQEQYEFPIVFHSNQTFLSFFLLVIRQLLLLVVAFMISNAIIPHGLVFTGILRFPAVVAGMLVIGAFVSQIPPMKLLLELLDNWATGAGRWTPVVYVRDVLSYQARACGMSFQSSIFNDPSSQYYNAVIWSYQGGRAGDIKGDQSQQFRREVFDRNKPIKTTIDLLESLSSGFRADYRLINGTLYFEEIDFFKELASVQVADIVQLSKTGAYDACYEFKSGDLCAYLEASYGHDGRDLEANKALGGVDASNYRDRLEFNDPPSEAQKGVCRVDFDEYGAARFMFDSVSKERTGFLDIDLAMDKFRSGKDGFLGVVFGNRGIVRHYDLIVGAGQASKFKILIAEPNGNPNDLLILKKLLPNETDFYAYNYPMFFQEDLPETLGESELLTNFHWKSNPRIKTDNLSLDSFDTACSCDIMDAALNNFDSLYLNTHFGKGFPSVVNFKVDPESISVEMSDIDIDCK
jgi:hypothetical protein